MDKRNRFQSISFLLINCFAVILLIACGSKTSGDQSNSDPKLETTQEASQQDTGSDNGSSTSDGSDSPDLNSGSGQSQDTGDSTSGGGGSAVPTPGSGGTGDFVGPAGGSITALDGRLSLLIPSGALDSDTFVSIDAIKNETPQGVGVAYNLLPDGLTLNKPATLTLHYSDADTAGSNAQMLGIAFKDGQGIWKALTTGSLNTVSKTLSVQITHFSEWAPYAAYRIEPPRADILTDGTEFFEVFTVYPPILPELEVGETLLVPLPVRVRPSEWAVNGIVGGNAEVGSMPEDGTQGLVGEGLYIAPSKMPNTNPVAVSARVILEDGSEVLLVANTMIVARKWALGYDVIQKMGCDGPDNSNWYSYIIESSASITFTLGEDFKVASYDSPQSEGPFLNDVGVCPAGREKYIVDVEVTPGQGVKMSSPISGGYEKGYLKETEPEFFELVGGGGGYIGLFTIEHGVGQHYLKLESISTAADEPKVVLFYDERYHTPAMEVDEGFSYGVYGVAPNTFIYPVKEFNPYDYHGDPSCEVSSGTCLLWSWYLTPVP